MKYLWYFFYVIKSKIGLEKTSEMTELYDMQSPFIDIDIILLDTKFYIEKITIEYPIINKIIIAKINK